MFSVTWKLKCWELRSLSWNKTPLRHPSCIDFLCPCNVSCILSLWLKWMRGKRQRTMIYNIILMDWFQRMIYQMQIKKNKQTLHLVLKKYGPQTYVHKLLGFLQSVRHRSVRSTRRSVNIYSLSGEIAERGNKWWAGYKPFTTNYIIQCI